MRSFNTLVLSTAIFLIACFFASCEKAEVQPNLPNKIKLVIEGMSDTYEFVSSEDYSNTVLQLPKGGDYEMHLEVASNAGIEVIWWDLPRYFFDHGDFISSNNLLGINGPSIHRKFYSHDEDYLASKLINASWEMETWGPNKDLGSLVAKPIHLKFMDRHGNELVMDITVEYSDGAEGLFHL